MVRLPVVGWPKVNICGACWKVEEGCDVWACGCAFKHRTGLCEQCETSSADPNCPGGEAFDMVPDEVIEAWEVRP